MTLAELTERRREVATLVGLGLDYQTVAARLGISRSTVRVHVEWIASKVGRHGLEPRIRVMQWVLEQRAA